MPASIKAVINRLHIITSELPPPPYQEETRVNGWRFELDVERIKRSDTWVLCDQEIRPWLLMVWMTAWDSCPAGSLPKDHRLIAAHIGMPAAKFSAVADSLLRGFVEHSDGRIYHPIIVQQVLALLNRRAAETSRKASWRERIAKDVPCVSRGTDKGQTRDRQGTDVSATTQEQEQEQEQGEKKLSTADTPRDRTTSEGECATENPKPPDTPSPPVDDAKPPGSSHLGAVAAGAACLAMRKEGLVHTNPQHPDLIALIRGGVTVEELADAAREAASRHKGFAYALGVAKGRHDDRTRSPPNACNQKTIAAAIQQAKQRIFGDGNDADD